MSFVLQGGEKLTVLMDNDWLKYFNLNKNLKHLKRKSVLLQEDIVELDAQIYPVDRKFNWERVDWEYRIDQMQKAQESICKEQNEADSQFKSNDSVWMKK